MPDIGPVELIIILVIALLVIGPGKLPDVGAALGRSIREFRKAASDVQDAVKTDAPVTPGGPAPVSPAPAVTPTVVGAVPSAPAVAAPDVSVPVIAAPPVAMDPAVAAIPVVAPAVTPPPVVTPVVTPAPARASEAAPITAPTTNELSAPVMPDPAATAADAATEARV